MLTVYIRGDPDFEIRSCGGSRWGSMHHDRHYDKPDTFEFFSRPEDSSVKANLK